MFYSLDKVTSVILFEYIPEGLCLLSHVPKDMVLYLLGNNPRGRLFGRRCLPLFYIVDSMDSMVSLKCNANVALLFNVVIIP